MTDFAPQTTWSAEKLLKNRERRTSILRSSSKNPQIFLKVSSGLPSPCSPSRHTMVTALQQTDTRTPLLLSPSPSFQFLYRPPPSRPSVAHNSPGLSLHLQEQGKHIFRSNQTQNSFQTQPQRKTKTESFLDNGHDLQLPHTYTSCSPSLQLSEVYHRQRKSRCCCFVTRSC